MPVLAKTHPEPLTVVLSTRPSTGTPLSAGTEHRPELSEHDLLDSARRTAKSLPTAMREALGKFAAEPNESGTLLIRNVPIGQLGRTPATPTTSTDKCTTSEASLLAAAEVLGHAVGYLPELGGRIVQNIVPVATSATRQVSTSSRVQLLFHTEAAFHPHRPHYLLLLCLRGDPAAATTFSSIQAVAPTLSAETLSVLRAPRFRTAPDESYRSRHDTAPPLGPAMSVLAGSENEPTLAFDADLMIGNDAEAESALIALAAAIAANHSAVTLEAGDLLVIDNTVAVHGRSPFIPRFDGTDRWLQRSFVVSDLAPSAADRIGRVIATKFD